MQESVNRISEEIIDLPTRRQLSRPRFDPVYPPGSNRCEWCLTFGLKRDGIDCWKVMPFDKRISPMNES